MNQNALLRRIAAVTIATISIVFTPKVDARQFFDHGPAPKFVEFEAQAMIGGTSIMQNYYSCFNEIRQLNVAMGTGWGIGGTIEFGIRDYMALGTQINLLTFNSRVDMAVTNSTATTVNNIFLRNRAHYLNFPVYLSLRFNPSANIRWNADVGFYYSYGVGGSQSQSIYTTMVNDLGDLLSNVYTSKVGYFANNETFINRFRRPDSGIYLATGLNFARHYHLGIRSTIGLMNTSHTEGLKNPSIRNTSIMFVAGYRF